ncbi:DUF4082 domain-containing protein [Embleya sp. NPDC001921]
MATYRLWPATNGNPTDEATNAINLGTEIVLSATGWATDLHFWRATLSEVGPVTGAIYAVVSGSQVPGTAVSFTLSGTGWHTATLAAPVQLTAGVRYIVVIRHTDRYAGTGAYFASGPGASGITNGILTAPSAAAVSSAPIGNGRFTEAGAIAAPTGTFNGGCYWSDVTVSDVNPGGTDYTATPGELLGLTDTAARALDAARTSTDTIGLVDQATTTVDTARVPGETLGLTDQATATIDRVTTPTDPLGLTDIAAAQVDASRGPAELLGLADTATALLDTDRAATDTLGLTDSVTATLGRALAVTVLDTLGLTDDTTEHLDTPGADRDIRIGPPHTSWRIGPPHT